MGAGRESKLTRRWNGVTQSVVITKCYDVLKNEREKDRKKESEKLKENKISSLLTGAVSEDVHRLRRVELATKRSMKTSPDCKALETD